MSKKLTTSSISVNSAQTTGISRFFNLRLVIAIFTVGIALYGLRLFLVTRDGNENQDELAVSAGDASEKEALVPVERGRSWKEIDDPSKDGWDTEVLANQAKKQLKLLGSMLADLDVNYVSKLVADDFACEPLRPADLTTVIDDQYLKIERAASAAPLPDLGKGALGETEMAALKHRGADGLMEAMRATFAPFENAVDLHFKGKVFKVLKTADGVLTRQYVSISANKPVEAKSPGKIELHATWDIGWIPGTDGEKPRMRWIRVLEFEQTESYQPGGTLFVDCTKSVLGGSPVYTDQFLRGMNHWFERIQDRGSDVLRAHPGLALGDVNGDGLDDLYVCQETGLPNRLFIQNADGTASEESEQWGVDWLQSSRSSLLVDLDNDKDQDLVVAILGGVVVAENDGQGKFHLREVLETQNDVMSLSAADYDMDGRLDIYACLYFENKELGSSARTALASAAAGFAVHDANNGGHNVLFQNQTPAEGDWRFVNVTKDVGLDVNNHRYSLAASWDDFDNDGDLDLYVSNDFGRDHLYRNDPSGAANAAAGRRFVDISDAAHIEDSATGMSTSWADYDRDGWMDVFIANMWSSAGNRITFQEQFKTDATPEAKRRIQRVARGNTLLKNQGDGTFADHSAPAGIEMGRWAWGTNFVDLNNDGWEDVVVANGYITTEDTGDL
jgi:hypothetical protein